MSEDDPRDIALMREVERLALELADRSKFADQAAQLAWIIDVLIERGHLTERHRSIASKIRAQQQLRVFVAPPDPDPEPDIDCASLLHLCHARCCSFKVALTADEVRDGRVPWELETPYVLGRDLDTGYCSHLDERGSCRCYGARPSACRKYDCRRDPRVWLDFDARKPAPMPWGVVPLGTKPPR
jgi:hypothetical protein